MERQLHLIFIFFAALVLGIPNHLSAECPLTKIEVFVESSANAVSAYDIEAHFNSMMTDPSFGAENVFNAAQSSSVSVAALDATYFVVAYVDDANSSQGTAIIGQVSGTTISSYGSESIFNAATSSQISVSALDATHFVVAYSDNGNSDRGTAIIGVTNGGTTISSYGSETEFNSTGNTTVINTAALDATHFVISYRDNDGGDDGTAIAGEVSGGTTITFGAEVDFSSNATKNGIAALDATHFVVAFRDISSSLDGFARVGVVSSGTTITFGTASEFNNADTESVDVAALDATHFVVTYQDQGNSNNGTAIIGLTDGSTTISSYGSENVFSTGTTSRTSVAALSASRFIVTYVDDNNSSQGASIIGEVSGTTISSYGSEVIYNTGATGQIHNKFIAKLSSSSFVTGYEDIGNSEHGTGIVGIAQSSITVNTTDDEVNSDGDCSLREAIQAANTNAAVDACPAGSSSENDIINIPDGTYDLSTVGTQLNISSEMTLNGTSEAGTIIQANASAGVATFRVMEIDAVDVDVTVEDMTIRHGRVSGRGSGIFIEPSSSSTSGTIAFTRVTSTANQGIGSSDSGPGLAVDNSPTSNTVTITDCTFSNNSGFFGGVANLGASNFSMTNSIISGNTTEAVGDRGGALALQEGTNTITGCSIINNTISGGAGAGTDGSGVMIADASSSLTLTNCTISGNTSNGTGAGVAIDNASSCSIINCTIVNNTSNNESGGGLKAATAVTVTNTIIANNAAASGGNDVQSSATITQTTSLVEDCGGTCPSWSYTSDPNLSLIATCGSPGLSYYDPQSPSDAINTGTAPGGGIPATDICGTAVTSVKDIGSRETSVVVPVELTFLKAHRKEASVQLIWQTASEINNKGFEIEWAISSQQSTFGSLKWQSIGFVKGAGESFDLKDYQFVHERPANGINYYRLKQMDYDGVFEYSSVVSVDFLNLGGVVNLRIAPNPAQNGTFTVYLPDVLNEVESISLDLIDYTGKQLTQYFISNKETTIDVSNIQPGIYFLKATIGAKRIFERIAIQ